MIKFLKELFKLKEKPKYVFNDEEKERFMNDPENIKKTNDIIKTRRDKMASLICPLVQKNCILDECINFQRESYYVINGNNYLKQFPYIHINKPKCKLWGMINDKLF